MWSVPDPRSTVPAFRLVMTTVTVFGDVTVPVRVQATTLLGEGGIELKLAKTASPTFAPGTVAVNTPMCPALGVGVDAA